MKKTKTDWAFFLRDEMYPYIDGFEHSDKDVAKHCEKLAEEIANTATAVLDEIEREVEAGDLTRKFMESLEHPTPEEYYAYNQGIADIKAIISNFRNV